MRRSAEILNRPGGGFAERSRCMGRPIRIAQHLSRQEHQIGFTVGDHGVRLSGLGSANLSTCFDQRLAAFSQNSVAELAAL
jgi:hypothetical protein